MAVLPSTLRSGEAAKVHTKLANERRSQSPRSFTALAHLGLLARPTKTAMLPQATGKISSTAATAKCRYDLPKVRYRSNGLMTTKQKMFQFCEELTAYERCTESRFFVVTLCLITDELTHERETIIVQRTDFVRFCRSFCLKKPTEKLPSFSSNFT